MSWAVRFEGSDRVVEVPSAQRVLDGVREGEWEPTDDVRGPADQVSHAIEGVKGVASVKMVGKEDGVVSLEVRTHNNADQREPVSQTLASRGWTVRRLERKRRKREEEKANGTRDHLPKEIEEKKILDKAFRESLKRTEE